MTDAIHGALDATELAGLCAKFPLGIADFAVNTNPYGPAPGVKEAVQRASLERYPDQTARGLRDHWAEALGLDASEIAFGNGGADLIWAACRAYLGPTRALLTLEPTFSEAGDCANAMGAPHFSLPLFGEGLDFGHRPLPVTLVTETMRRIPSHVSLVYLCSPNNPTGAVWTELEIQALEEAIRPARLLLDRSFETLRMDHNASISNEPMSARALFGIKARPTRIEIRSFTKDFALPGIRIGAAFGARDEIARCQRQLCPWSVSAPATMAAYALTDAETMAHLQVSRARWWVDAKRTFEGLEARGFRLVPSVVPFALVSTELASAARTSLLEHGVHVRDCASFGLPSFIRLAGRPEEDRERLFEALSSVFL